jgi:DNA polymerase-3 subunit delta'
MAERINVSAANKLLKLLEEPPEKTVFILCCESEYALLETISSRCQKITLNSLQNSNVSKSLQRFDNQFVVWLRAAFRAKKDKRAINELLSFSESISKATREEQKAFLLYCSEVFRDSLHYRTKSKDNSGKYVNELELKKFAPFVNELNIDGFYQVLQKAFEDIGRNGNPKIIFTDLSIKLTRLLHKKPSADE